MRKERIIESKIMSPHKLETLEIDIKNKIFRINGEDFGKKCANISIVCSPPEWHFSVIINRPIEFVSTYDLEGKKKNRTAFLVQYGKKIKK